MLIHEFKSKKHNEMLKVFNSLNEEGLYMSHYELGRRGLGYTVEEWRTFLQLEEVSEYIKDEISALLDTETRKLLKSIGSGKGQVGLAQLLTAIDKRQQAHDEKTGPAFIYCYIPLNENEKHAENVQIIDEDPFLPNN